MGLLGRGTSSGYLFTFQTKKPIRKPGCLLNQLNWTPIKKPNHFSTPTKEPTHLSTPSTEPTQLSTPIKESPTYLKLLFRNHQNGAQDTHPAYNRVVRSAAHLPTMSAI